jgi:predicted nucleic acid-binding protein
VIFLDASVLLAAEDTDDREHPAALRPLRGGDLATLDLAFYETTNVAITRWRDPAAADRLRARIWSIAELGTLVRLDETLSEVTAHLAAEHNLSAYDAAYVAGAQRLAADLASCDRRDLVSDGHAHLQSTLTP